MDVVWLKRDVRLHDHGPLAEVAQSRNPFVLLYLYEPDQLREPTVHGSHLRFVHEGLLDLERRWKNECPLSGNTLKTGGNEQAVTSSHATFEYLTICHNTAIATLEAIHRTHPIGRLLSHEETGHWQSYMRDRAVRKWCRSNKVKFVEFNQTGVTRNLKCRDDYNILFNAFMAKPRHPTPNVESLQSRVVQLRNLPGFIGNLETNNITQWDSIFTEIPADHRHDRHGRQQFGGETKALATMDSFLQERGSKFSQDISSPNTAWNSCSRLSPYLAWGHISLRFVVHSLQHRQEALKRMKAQGRNTGTWLRSLQAFSSRLHWRSHFIQKLESEPVLELRDLCPAFQHLRRQDDDWVEARYVAWSTGTTGFPFVDACMRCLLEHGWINFRMRAMLVSFACYNLWLDWKRIAPHLARVFLDFEPGIHYPQLQMQAGTTGINAMRVYSVTKQGKDQDPTGKFIRRHVLEMERVPDQYIHEPWKMPQSLQEEIQLTITSRERADQEVSLIECATYPEPIVNEQESAKIAKARMSDVRKQESTKNMAKEVFVKHGSRNNRSHVMNKPKSGTGVYTLGKQPISLQDNQPKISDVFGEMIGDSKKKPKQNRSGETKRSSNTITQESELLQSSSTHIRQPKKSKTTTGTMEGTGGNAFLSANAISWNCLACTFRNENKPFALVCEICGTNRGEKSS
ncbi:cytochrome/photolyase-like protein [Nitzschia inconspicua]|uniref:Cytochrome/photolyase-like protein n=1 Tax=Nitzschia inconspicua TaxID=303405 RepID=A0A9K3K6E1_9STRA|nr:cytochrome/photolyase-like protein [Nitzschia inconspicua]KAG7367477.1 cytochrome/photolyase-like protein [Nitzschia inconspicua]